MTAFRQRRACPGLSAPMPTGDGLLVRFVPIAPMRIDRFALLCAMARRDGNGTLEISARGSLQVRGLTEASAPDFAMTMGALGIGTADGRVIASPLDDALEALVDTVALAHELRRAIGKAKLALAPKLSVVVDGGGSLHLDALRADIRLRAYGPAQRPRLGVFIGGDGGPGREQALGSIEPGEAATVVLALLRAIAAQGQRAADLIVAAGGAPRAEALGITGPAPVLPRRPPAEPIGRHALRDGTLALGIALAFGHASADALGDLMIHAAACGCYSVSFAPGRALLLIGVAGQNAATLAAAAQQLGFIVDAADPRRRIVACPGAPACGSGLIAARAIASTLVPLRHGVIHVSGCPKGCAHPAAAVLTIVGTARGCGMIRNGTARAVPDRHVDLADLAAAIAAVAPVAEAAHG
jgi:precorrin-3B synthase